MNLGDIKTILRTALGRGTTLDDMIVTHIKAAINLIESRRSWKYMETEGTLTLSASATKPNVGTLDSGRIKELQWVRRTDEDTQEFIDIPAAQSTQFSKIEGGFPNGYYILGDNTLVFDTNPDEDLIVTLQYYRWTDVPDSDAFECWLTKYAPLLVVAHTLTLLAALIRNNSVAQLYLSNLTMYDSAACQADDDLRYGGRSLEFQA